MKQNLQFPDGKLAVKSINEVYADSNGNVTVDHVATADAIGSTTATQVADTVNKAHTHDNKTTLDKLADASGKLTYNGSEIGGTVDESRLLPANPSDYDLAIYRVFPEEAAPQNLTSATSDPNWEVTWSGEYSDRVGWQAFDSDQSTTWCTYYAAVGDWLCWEYKGTEGSVLLRRYSIAKGSGNGDCPTGWKIQGSNDGSTWVDLDEQTGQSFPDNNAKEYTIPNNSTHYKFHRFYLLSWNISNMIGTFKAWSWINSTEEREVWIPINKSEFVVNEARLLPTGGRNGNLLEYQGGVDRGNNVNTKLLIQPATSDGLIVDQAAGNAAPVTLENHNVTVNEEGNMVFNGSGYLKIAANTLPADLMGQDMDYTIDILYTATSKSRQCLFGRGDSPRMDFLLDSNGSLQIGGGPNLGTGWPFDTEVLLTFECWKEDTVWRYTCYRDGAVVTSDTWGSSNWRGSDMWIGWEGNTGGRELTGQIKALRLSNTALHKGTAFSPDYPWTKPQTVGKWGLINKTSLVNSINGITPDDTGNVTLDLLTEEQLSKLNSIVLANDFTFTQSDIVSNMITKNATTLGVPAGSMVQVLSNTGIVMTERAGILVYWSGNNLTIDFTGYFNTTQTTLTGTWTVKFAGNFVGSGSGGSGTVAAIAYPIVLVKPAYTEAVHLEMVYATQDDYSDAQTLVNTKTTSADRSLVKAFGGTAWETCPSGGFGSVYDKQPVKIIVSSKLDATTIYNIKYRWISASSDTSISEWYGMVYPCYSVSQ